MISQEEHLSDEQFGSLLAGDGPSAEVAGHLEACELCRAELKAVGIAVEDLASASAQWAQTVAPRVIGTPSRWERAMGGRVPWAAGASVTALAGLLAFGLHRHPVAEAVPVHPAALVAAPNATALADDNRLMLSISQELTYRANAPVLAADAGDTEHDRQATRAAAVEN